MSCGRQRLQLRNRQSSFNLTPRLCEGTDRRIVILAFRCGHPANYMQHAEHTCSSASIKHVFHCAIHGAAFLNVQDDVPQRSWGWAVQSAAVPCMMLPVIRKGSKNLQSESNINDTEVLALSTVDVSLGSCSHSYDHQFQSTDKI